MGLFFFCISKYLTILNAKFKICAYFCILYNSLYWKQSNIVIYPYDYVWKMISHLGKIWNGFTKLFHIFPYHSMFLIQAPSKPFFTSRCIFIIPVSLYLTYMYFKTRGARTHDYKVYDIKVFPLNIRMSTMKP